MRFSIGLTRLPLSQFTWANIDKKVDVVQPAPAENTIDETVKENDNV